MDNGSTLKRKRSPAFDCFLPK